MKQMWLAEHFFQYKIHLNTSLNCQSLQKHAISSAFYTPPCTLDAQMQQSPGPFSLQLEADI